MAHARSMGQTHSKMSHNPHNVDKKIKKSKIKQSEIVTPAPKYYLQLINYKQRGLDPRKM